DLHKGGDRQGPGGDAQTELALTLSMLDRTAPLKLADIGCGTGASTLLLARLLEQSRITAVDFLPEFLERLQENAAKAGVADRIRTLACSMDDLPFAESEFDVIWSEGAIYNMGFEKGVKDWRRFLKRGGLLVVSEITWITETRPEEIQAHWDREYPEIDVASGKMRILEENGYSPVGYFVLPENCWLEQYYQPMQPRFDDFLERHSHCQEARGIVDAERHEIGLYEKYKDYISYGVYVARKTE
ncbi:MAG: class I SAM-dependent methyltransferase, partial [Kiritimatiellia bacterium]